MATTPTQHLGSRIYIQERCETMREKVISKAYLRWLFILAAMTWQDLSTRWSGGILTWCWALIQPVAQIAIYAVVFSAVMTPAASGLENHGQYLVYLCSGYFCWIGFSEAISLGSTSLRDATSVLRAMPLPLALFPMRSVGGAWLLAAIGFFCIITIAPLLGVTPGWSWILLPFPLLDLVCLSCGIALALAPVTVLARDTEQLVRLILPLLFWLTPIVYVPSILPDVAQHLLKINPLQIPISMIHQIVLRRELPEAMQWTRMLVTCSLIVTTGACILRQLEDEVRDVI